ncbi:MAG: cbb3-type cytochrome c oxidase subunit I [Ilumatobacteraceae bacterium]
MTTIDRTIAPTAQAEPAGSVAHASAGPGTAVVATIGAWITTSDHKRLGRMLMVGGLIALVGIGGIGALLGFERADSGSLLESGSIQQLFAINRVGLAFFVVLPVMLGLSVAVVPLQIGARSLAFPRLAAAGFWAWFAGMAMVITSIASNGGPGGGTSRFVALFISSYGVMLLGLTAIAVSLATTVLTSRAPGMNMRRIPLFSWSVLVSALGLVLVLPVAIGTVIYLYVSYRYNRQPFDGNSGLVGFGPGTDASSNWLGFSLTQPTTFIYALPAIGFFAELLPLVGRKRMPKRGTMMAGIALVGVAILGGVTQTQQTLPWTGSKLYLGDFFWDKLGHLLTYAFLFGLPVLGAVVVLMLAPMAFLGSKPKLSVPFLFAFFGFSMVLVGMLGNLLTGIEELRLLGTVFEEGAYVYICYGAILSVMGGIVHWGPKLWGRTMDPKKVAPFALLGVAATVLASLPYYIAGFADQPADAVAFDYSGPQNLWNVLVGVGHGLMVLTVLGFLGLALQSFRKGELAGDDPWDGQTLEWATSSPPPVNNFSTMHSVASAEPLVDLKPAPVLLEENS